MMSEKQNFVRVRNEVSLLQPTNETTHRNVICTKSTRHQTMICLFCTVHILYPVFYLSTTGVVAHYSQKLSRHGV